MTKVLVAIDGSEHANRAFAAAARLFGKHADYVAVSVVPPWSFATALGANEDLDLPGGQPPSTALDGSASTGMPYAPTASSVEATMQGLYDYYREMQREAQQVAGVKAESVIEEAHPHKRRIGRAIIEAAEEHRADVIVVGPHGSSFAGETLLGSVSQYVIHHAPCPVVICRDND
jgi:nucleotide-binding universal stress UspA family protein